jgi:hypothetical protein
MSRLRERGVARMQVRGMAQVVHEHRTAGAARVRPTVHAGREHEVIDEQLPAAFEQVEQACLAVRAVEHVILFDAQHRLPAALGGQRVARAGRLLLQREHPFLRGLPFLRRNDRRQRIHFGCLAIIGDGCS